MGRSFHPEFIQHNGQTLLRLDYTGLSLAQALASLQQAMAVIASQPLHSVRALTIWDISLNSEAAESIKRHVVHNTPYILASAVVTGKPFQKVVFECMRVEGRERLKTFDDERQAMDWLAAH